MPVQDASSPQYAYLNLTAGTTQIKIGPSRFYSLSIISSGPAGSVNDVVAAQILGSVTATGAVAPGNQILSVPANASGTYQFNGGWPCQAGIAVTVAASAVYAIAYS